MPSARPCFRRAAELYEELRLKGVASMALFHNQGNASLLADDLPGAILAYRRGLRLKPNDRSLQELLAHAREQVAYPSADGPGRPPVENRPPWLPRLPANVALLLACFLYSTGWLALTRWWMVRRGWLLTLAAVAFVAVGVLTLLLVAQAVQDRYHERHPLVVMAQDGVLLRKGNSERYPPRCETPFPRGVEARLLLQRGDWLQIELTEGDIGWVHRAQVLVDKSQFPNPNSQIPNPNSQFPKLNRLISDLGFGIWDLGFGIWDLGFGIFFRAAAGP
jgi:hypothetical protein